MNISDFSTDANTLEQQVADVKAYALANYNNGKGWDLVIETMSDEDIAKAIGKRKNTRAAINAVYAHNAGHNEQRRAHKNEADAGNPPEPKAEPIAPVVESVAEPIDSKGVGELSPEAVRRARRTAAQKARREAARAAKA